MATPRRPAHRSRRPHGHDDHGCRGLPKSLLAADFARVFDEAGQAAQPIVKVRPRLSTSSMRYDELHLQRRRRRTSPRATLLAQAQRFRRQGRARPTHFGDCDEEQGRRPPGPEVSSPRRRARRIFLKPDDSTRGRMPATHETGQALLPGPHGRQGLDGPTSPRCNRQLTSGGLYARSRSTANVRCPVRTRPCGEEIPGGANGLPAGRRRSG